MPVASEQSHRTASGRSPGAVRDSCAPGRWAAEVVSALLLEKRRKKGGEKTSTESMQRALIESPTAFAISGAYQAGEQTAMLGEQREQRVNSHLVGIDCGNLSFQRQRQSQAEYPATKKEHLNVFLQLHKRYKPNNNKIKTFFLFSLFLEELENPKRLKIILAFGQAFTFKL